ncbi:lysozyme inhibitor LprI family protein [Comamonas endophytica]|uniref:Lysozyme inhibitor LprI family protein n=1 Tax=Comamonas endophytica TaxID=2949090 RepID=A0ABY6GB27_9BURK|nr:MULTISPECIES: lysozyme inhibitor LprI family protein [unclassified Acidovorax]MCD2511797.1 lysozyme inhibitor LprI family protein [Acidovorax sp. D4N7]UYG51520.1 lysozyme inhibitor LprI family protein [Acidovorax sp. 5MLIR]
MNALFSPSLLGTAILALALLPGSSHAQAGGACDRAAADAAARNACAVQDFQAADTANTILYGDVMRALSAHERPALRRDQSAWSRQRTQGCKAAHARDEALEDWPARLHHCLRQATEARRAALLHWLQHGEAPAQR